MKNKLKTVLIFTVITSILGSACGCASKKENTAAGGGTTLRWVLIGKNSKDAEDVFKKFNEDLKSKAGMSVDFQTIASGSYSEKINLMISSKEDFDLCFTSDWLNTYSTNVNKGSFLKLDDKLEAKPKLKEAIPDYIWNSAKIGGSLYAVPNYQISYLEICAVIRKSLVQKYNLDVSGIHTLKDLEPVLAVLKEKEPNLIPFKWSWTPLGLYYESVPGASQLYVKKGDESLKVYAPYEAPEYIDYMKLMRSWYEKGYLPSDVATRNAGDNAKNYAVGLSTLKPGIEVNEMKTYGETLEHIQLAEPYVNSSSGQGTMTAVMAMSKKADKAVELLELINTDKDLYNTLCFGIEGRNYKKVTDNRIEKLNEDYNSLEAWAVGKQFNAYVYGDQKDDVWEQTQKNNESAAKSKLIGFSFNSANVTNEMTAVSAVQSEYSGFLDCGIENPEDHIDEYINKMKAAGIEKIKAELEKQIEEWKKTK